MKKISALFCLVALATSAFALNAEYSSAKDVQKKVAAAQKAVQKYDSFRYTGASFLEIIGTYEEVYLIDMEEATSLNQMLKKAVFTTAKGERALITSSVIQDAINYAIEHGSFYARTDMLGDFAEENVVDNFYKHLEKPYCPGQNWFEETARKLVSEKKYEVLAQFIYINVVQPFTTLDDEQAVTLAKCYITYEVGNRSLLDHIREGQGMPSMLGTETDLFVGRVEALAK